MSTGSGHNQRQENRQKTVQTQKTKLWRGIYADTALPEPEDERDESLLDEGPEYVDAETQEDDFFQENDEGPEEIDDPFFVPSFSLTPVKWIWVPVRDGKSRLIWASANLVPRFDALEIFRLFLEKILNIVYDVETSFYPEAERTEGYRPPDPTDLEGFFMEKQLVKLVKITERGRKSKNLESDGEKQRTNTQFSWGKYLGGFTIAVPKTEGYSFVQVDSLIAKAGGGGGYIPDPLLKRWMNFEIRGKNRNVKHFNHNAAEEGWFMELLREYVEKLNLHLELLIGETDAFKPYTTLRNKVGEVRGWFFSSKKAGRKNDGEEKEAEAT
jgi:hypothetical protein